MVSNRLRRFQLVRTIAARDDWPSIDIIVVFLMPRVAKIAKNAPPFVDDFAVQRAHGAELALEHRDTIRHARQHARWPSQRSFHFGDFGPTSVRTFVDGSPSLLGQQTLDQSQQDAYGQVHAWLDRLGLP